jgi:hypothetical protein
MKMDEERIIEIAEACHNVNRAYCRVLGDDSQPQWDYAQDWQRDSAIAGVKQLLENDSLTPGRLHEAWLTHKQNEGWVCGEKKDPEAKTHPCMVPFDELPRSLQTKDVLFAAIVRGLRDEEAATEASKNLRWTTYELL